MTHPSLHTYRINAASSFALLFDKYLSRVQDPGDTSVSVVPAPGIQGSLNKQLPNE